MSGSIPEAQLILLKVYFKVYIYPFFRMIFSNAFFLNHIIGNIIFIPVLVC